MTNVGILLIWIKKSFPKGNARFKKISGFPAVVNITSGLYLLVFGAMIFFRGTAELGF